LGQPRSAIVLVLLGLCGIHAVGDGGDGDVVERAEDLIPYVPFFSRVQLAS
jgi:hypothetical protein